MSTLCSFAIVTVCCCVYFLAAPRRSETEWVAGYSELRSIYIYMISGEIEDKRTKETSLIYSENHTVVQDWEKGNIAINRTDFGFRRAAVRLINNGNQDSNVFSISVRADAYYRDTEASVSVGEADTPYTCQSEYIFTAAKAESLAKALSCYFVGSKYKITFSSDTTILPGTFITLDSGLSGFQTHALVINSSINLETNVYSITAISIGSAKVNVKRWKDLKSNGDIQDVVLGGITDRIDNLESGNSTEVLINFLTIIAQVHSYIV